MARFAADAPGPQLVFAKSRSGSIGSHAIVVDDDTVGALSFRASDGADFGTLVVQIQGKINDASPAASSIGGALVFRTAAGVAANDIGEAMRIFANKDIRLSAATSALATNATGGFPGMPTMAGDSSITPTNETAGFAPFCYDTTNNEFKVFNPISNTWRVIAMAVQ